VDVHRFYRPVDNDGINIGNRGIGVIFTILHTTKKFTAKYSICKDETFCKKDAIKYAQKAYDETGRLILGDYNPELSLFDNLKEVLEDGEYRRTLIFSEVMLLDMLNEISLSNTPYFEVGQ
jgi:hypothetical protein